MYFNIITIFPKLFEPYLSESILKRAKEKKLIEFSIHDLRDFTDGKHGKVDDSPYGGGPGMAFKIEPMAKATDSILTNNKKKTKIVLFSAAGKEFNAKLAAEYAKKYDRIIMIAGRYEGVDERIKKIYKIEELSIGPYVLTGGELPALVVIDAVSRHIPGVLGKLESLEEKRHGVGVPVYTRPEVFEWKGKKYKVPEVLVGGDHKKIEEWRKNKVNK